ncbi:MAG TPA: FtsX-like permease family protein, partial [Thermoanaerobaculia bacterium]|nr:FtsX-like permease family protein [Thermoanaerobaculia bacterium]
RRPAVTLVLLGPFGPQPVTVAGVASDTISRDLTDRGLPFLYLPWEGSGQTAGILHVRTGARTGQIAGELRRIVAGVDPGVPVSELTTMSDHLAVALAQPRALAAVLGVYGLLGALLAGTGVFGTVSYRLGLRAREIGIRLALGGSRGSVFRSTAQGTALTSLVGLAIGVAGGVLLGKILILRIPGLEAPGLTLAGSVTAFLVLLVAVAATAPTALSLARDPLNLLRTDG